VLVVGGVVQACFTIELVPRIKAGSQTGISECSKGISRDSQICDMETGTQGRQPNGFWISSLWTEFCLVYSVMAATPPIKKGSHLLDRGQQMVIFYMVFSKFCFQKQASLSPICQANHVWHH
jgi:hypothetical protein